MNTGMGEKHNMRVQRGVGKQKTGIPKRGEGRKGTLRTPQVEEGMGVLST